MRKLSLRYLIIIFAILTMLCGCVSRTVETGKIDKIEPINYNVTSENEVLKGIPTFNDESVDGILVKVYVNKNNVIYGYEVSGHSGYAEYGKDIVCAGASAIAQNVLTSIKTYTTDKVESEISEGYLKCILPNMKQEQGSKEACVLLKSAVVGFYSIQSSYDQQYIKVFKVVD